MPAGAVPQLDATGLPELANTLVVETYWLNPADAATIADKGLNSTDAGVIAAIAADLQAVLPPQNIRRHAPRTRAWQHRLVSSPWLPALPSNGRPTSSIVSRTEGSRQFSSPTPTATTSFDRTHWAFDGSDYDLDRRAARHPARGPADRAHGADAARPPSLFPQAGSRTYLARNPDADLQERRNRSSRSSRISDISGPQTLTGPDPAPSWR